MSQDIRDHVTPSTELLALGEPTHRVHTFAHVRNQLFVQLVDLGFRSIALETDRVAALAVNDYVRDATGTLDQVMKDGFTHEFGEWDANRELVAWMREHNAHHPADPLTFHGFDAPMETMSAPSPRPYLEHARDFLGLSYDIAGVAGDDDRWSRVEAVMDPAMSPGATPEAEQLRSWGDSMLAMLDPAEAGVRTHLTAGLGLLRYHRLLAQPLDPTVRYSRMSATRDGLMARNLLDIRGLEAAPTLVHAHNAHLQRRPSTWAEFDLSWTGAGAVVSALLGDRYTVIAGSLGRSASMELPDPAPDTYEGALQRRIDGWALTSAPEGRGRTDTTPQQGYRALDHEVLDGADAVLHISDAG